MSFPVKLKKYKRVPCKLVKEDKVQRQFKDSCDINRMIKRRSLTVSGKTPRWGDFSKFTNFSDAMLMVQEASYRFNKMPAKIRAKFENDPAKLLEFIGDENNRDEAIELGLIEKVSESQNGPSEEQEVGVKETPES